jgi:hypothetical protein
LIGGSPSSSSFEPELDELEPELELDVSEFDELDDSSVSNSNSSFSESDPMCAGSPS